MTDTIEVNTLRDWLESHQPVTVLDVRSDEDRAQWAIPGSLHVNAYQALHGGQAGPLASAQLPPDRPIVTVCNAGRISQAAAEFLAERGFDARISRRRNESVEPRLESSRSPTRGLDGPSHTGASDWQGLLVVSRRVR